MKSSKSPARAPETAFDDVPATLPHYTLRLYVAGMTPRSTEAFAVIKGICEENFRGRYDLEVVDLYQHPERAKEGQIIAAPTLVKQRPEPLRRFIGNLADRERLLAGLGILPPPLTN